MKKHLCKTCSFLATCVFLFLSIVSCTVDNRYDLSNEIDLTIGVGKGLTLPLGSSKKSFISEMLDTAEIDILNFDEVGNLVISSGDSFVSDSFKIDDITLNVTSQEDLEYYDFKATPYHETDYPVEGVPAGRILHVISDTIDIETEFKINDSNLPKEVKRITETTFKNPVALTLEIEISSQLEDSKKLLKTTDKLNLEGDNGKEYFEVYLPKYLVFEENVPFEDGVLMLDGYAKYNEDKEAICYKRVYYINAVDFTKTELGYLEVVDGCVDMNDLVTAHGIFKSDPTFFDVENLNKINEVEVRSFFQIAEMPLETVEGRFEPEINPVSEFVDLDLGEDNDYLKNAYVDFTDPRLAITFDNNIGAKILTDAHLVGYDENDNELENTRIDLNLEAKADDVTKIFIDRYGNQIPGWTNSVAPNLNELIKEFPDKVGVDLNVRFDNTVYSRVNLGENMAVAGSYELQLPLAFDSLGIEYTYSMEDVLGNNSDDTDEVDDYDDYDYRYNDSYYDSDIYEDNYDVEEDTDTDNTSSMVKEIRGVSLSFKVLNTLPVGLKPEISIYDEDGNAFDDVTFEIEGEIKRGNETTQNGVIGEPVESAVKVRFAAQNSELNNLYKIDIRLFATGKGVINSNQYIQLADIALRIDDYIVLDLKN